MRKVRLAGWLVAFTMIWALVMLLSAGKHSEPTPVRMAVVSRGSIRHIAAISGRMAYKDERLVYTIAPGMVEAVCVSPGDRVAAGDALIRLQSGALERAVSAWSKAGDDGRHAIGDKDIAELMENMVIRAPVNGTVRQLMTAESGMVAAGTPVAVLSAAEMELVCQVAEADAKDVRVGMQAELYKEGEYLCDAEVTWISELTADPLTGRLNRTITLEPEGMPTFPAGTLIDADICISHRENVTVLPLEAITSRDTVWWVHEGRCTEIPAEIVLSDEMCAWVRLPEGMLAALGEMQEGQRVVEVQP